MGKQTDMFAKPDPEEENERLLRDDLTKLLGERLSAPLTGGLREEATELGRLVAGAARARFSSCDDPRERFLALEAAVVLSAHVGRTSDEREVNAVVADIARRLSLVARKRLSPEKQATKKST